MVKLQILTMTENDLQRGDRDKYFKGQQANEELVCFFRKHWVTVLPHIVMGLLVGLIEIGFLLGFSKVSPVLKESAFFEFVFVGVVVLLTVYLHKTFFRLFAHFMDTYVFTNTRIVDHRRTLIMMNDHEAMDVLKIQDIQKRQDGFWKNLLSYGELVVTLSSDKSSKKIRYVPNVNFHYRCLARIKRDALAKQNDGIQDRSSGGLNTKIADIHSKIFKQYVVPGRPVK